MSATEKSGFVLFDITGLKPEAGAPAPERIVSGTPTNNSWNLYTSADNRFFSGIWESEPGCWKIIYDEDEFCHILEGESIITDKNGESFTVRAGDAFVIPRGFEGTWHVVTRTRKQYVIYAV